MSQKTCGHNCHLLRSGVECSPCKFKNHKTDNKMNTDREIIAHLKEIIRIKDERINDLSKANGYLTEQIERINEKPLLAVKKARLLLNKKILKARQQHKQELREIKAILDYESTERTIA